MRFEHRRDRTDAQAELAGFGRLADEGCDVLAVQIAVLEVLALSDVDARDNRGHAIKLAFLEAAERCPDAVESLASYPGNVLGNVCTREEFLRVVKQPGLIEEFVHH